MPNQNATLIQCKACDGDYSRLVEYEDGLYRTLICSWCSFGFMSIEQFRKWKKRKELP